MKRMVAIGILAVITSFSLPENIGFAAATCTGADPCKACKNCRYCKHCNADRGKCGICKKRKL